jgi:hypothetical protein
MAARALVPRHAIRRFGAAPVAAEELLASVTLERLERLAQHVLTAADWQSLLATASTVQPWAASVDYLSLLRGSSAGLT